MPTLTVSEEFNDNIYESRISGREEAITRVQPQLSASSVAKGLAWKMDYGLDYRNYARGSRDDEVNQKAGLNGKLSLLDDFLNIEIGETFSRVSLDVARDVVAESLVVRQTDQNAAYVSPSLNWHLTDNASLKTGYRYSDIRYWESSSVDKDEHLGFAQLDLAVTQALTASGYYNFAYTDSDTGSYRRHDLYAGLKYEPAEGTLLFGSVGNSWQNFSSGSENSNLIWDAGASKDLGIFVAMLRTSVVYTEDPLTLSTKETGYNVTLSRVFRRALATLSATYTQYERNQLRPGRRWEKAEVRATGNYELTTNLTMRMSAWGDHLSGRLNGEFPWHFNASVAMDYNLNKHAVLAANYSHISYRNKLDSTAGSREINRAIVELRLAL